MPRWLVLVEAMIQNDSDGVFLAFAQNLQRMFGLDGQGAVTPIQSILSDQMSGRGQAAEPVVLGNFGPDVRLGNRLSKRTVNHTQGRGPAHAVRLPIGLLFKRNSGGLRITHGRHSCGIFRSLRILLSEFASLDGVTRQPIKTVGQHKIMEPPWAVRSPIRAAGWPP